MPHNPPCNSLVFTLKKTPCEQISGEAHLSTRSPPIDERVEKG